MQGIERVSGMADIERVSVMADRAVQLDDPADTGLLRRLQRVASRIARRSSTAASEAEALDRFAEFSGKWEKRYPAIIRLWENAWAEFVPFLRFDREIRTVICTTNAIESINARLRRAVNARGHFL